MTQSGKAQTWDYQYSINAGKPWVFGNSTIITPQGKPQRLLLSDFGTSFSINVDRMIQNKFVDDRWAYHVGANLGFFKYLDFERGVYNRTNTIGLSGGINNEDNIFFSLGGNYHWQTREVSGTISLQGILTDVTYDKVPNTAIGRATKGLRVSAKLEGGIIGTGENDYNPYAGINIGIVYQKPRL